MAILNGYFCGSVSGAGFVRIRDRLYLLGGHLRVISVEGNIVRHLLCTRGSSFTFAAFMVTLTVLLVVGRVSSLHLDVVCGIVYPSRGPV